MDPVKCLAAVVFVLTVLLFSNSLCYITRLPCHYHGNFTKQNNKKNSGTILVTLNNIKSSSDCATHCVTNHECQIISYNTQDKICLLQDIDGINQENVGWGVFTQDRIDDMNRGPLCLSIKPCTDIQICYDTCDASFYECTESVALTGVASMSSTKDNFHASNAIDGEIGNPVAKSLKKIFQWWRLEFPSMYRVSYLTIYHPKGTNSNYDNSVWFVRIGKEDDPNGNTECGSYASVEIGPATIECGKLVPARYVFLTRKDGATYKKFLILNEVFVYGTTII